MGKFVMLILILLSQPCLTCRGYAEAARVDVRIIAVLESGGNPLAYNAKTQAYGKFQIRQCVITDYNTAGPGRSRPLVLSDMYDEFIAEYVADWYIQIALTKYLSYYKIPTTTENYLIAWHDGIGNLIKYLDGRKGLGPEMRAYLKMYAEIAH
jgi:hypothetical protein